MIITTAASYFLYRKAPKPNKSAEHVPLSLGAIKKRKRKIKEVFGISRGGDHEILDKAKELGVLVEKLKFTYKRKKNEGT